MSKYVYRVLKPSESESKIVGKPLTIGLSADMIYENVNNQLHNHDSIFSSLSRDFKCACYKYSRINKSFDMFECSEKIKKMVVVRGYYTENIDLENNICVLPLCSKAEIERVYNLFRPANSKTLGISENYAIHDSEVLFAGVVDSANYREIHPLLQDIMFSNLEITDKICDKLFEEEEGWFEDLLNLILSNYEYVGLDKDSADLLTFLYLTDMKTDSLYTLAYNLANHYKYGKYGKNKITSIFMDLVKKKLLTLKQLLSLLDIPTDTKFCIAEQRGVIQEFMNDYEISKFLTTNQNVQKQENFELTSEKLQNILYYSHKVSIFTEHKLRLCYLGFDNVLYCSENYTSALKQNKTSVIHMHVKKNNEYCNRIVKVKKYTGYNRN